MLPGEEPQLPTGMRVALLPVVALPLGVGGAGGMLPTLKTFAL